MVSRESIEYFINKSITNKCSITVGEMHTLLDGWSQSVKLTFLQHIVDINDYQNILDNGDEDEIFSYERRIFDEFTKKQRDNIVEYLSDFNKDDYKLDDDVGYPSKKRGKLEKKMENLQQKKGFSDDLIYAIKNHWTGGFYEDIQRYIMNGTLPSYFPKSVKEAIIESADVIRDYIQNSDGLNVNTVLYRGGHWDIGMKVGDVGEIPLLNSTSYSYDTAYELGIGMEDDNPNRYMITVFSPKGTKGLMVNSPDLSYSFPEHEYLLDKGQKYIVLNVNDEDKTAEILLIND